LRSYWRGHIRYCTAVSQAMKGVAVLHAVASVVRLGNRPTLFARASHFDAAFLSKQQANHVPLSPLTLFSRVTVQYPDQLAYKFKKERKTWKEVHHDCKLYASALGHYGVGPKDVVSIMAANTPLAFESHFAVLGARAVLHTINTRLNDIQIGFQLQHANSKIIIVDAEHFDGIMSAIKLLPPDYVVPPVVVVGQHNTLTHPARIRCISYESFLKFGSSTFQLMLPNDEWDACCLNYTSGTTGDPKGVIYTHRGAYLTALANAFESGLPLRTSFLWGNEF
jgi:fatty-acyl-CoA synthase